MFLGLDTSNYTTSAAIYSDCSARNVSRLLDVKPGELGLRQSDALFHHVQRLPEIVSELFHEANGRNIRAVAASTRPRAVEGSYMPCFLAGETLGRCIAKTLDVPFYAFSHQQGHIAASLWSAHRMDLMHTPHLAWHLSGGTTELLMVTHDGDQVVAEKIGGTSDISAGQVIDRTGRRLSLQFPAGKSMDKLSQASDCREKFSVKLNDLFFSFSGLENKIMRFMEQTTSDADIAAYTMNSVVDCIYRTTAAAIKKYPHMEVVFSGGVASNQTLRERCATFAPVFAEPEFSTDNALGIAVLCSMQEE